MKIKIFLIIISILICVSIAMMVVSIANNCRTVNVDDSDLIFYPTQVQDIGQIRIYGIGFDNMI